MELYMEELRNYLSKFGLDSLMEGLQEILKEDIQEFEASQRKYWYDERMKEAIQEDIDNWNDFIVAIENFGG